MLPGGTPGQRACCSCSCTHEPGGPAPAALQGCSLPTGMWDCHLYSLGITILCWAKGKRKKERESCRTGERPLTGKAQELFPVGSGKGCGIKPNQGLPHCVLRRENRTLQGEGGGSLGPPQWGTGKGLPRKRGCPSVSFPRGGCLALGGFLPEQGLWLIAQLPLLLAGMCYFILFFLKLRPMTCLRRLSPLSPPRRERALWF